MKIIKHVNEWSLLWMKLVITFYTWSALQSCKMSSFIRKWIKTSIRKATKYTNFNYIHSNVGIVKETVFLIYHPDLLTFRFPVFDSFQLPLLICIFSLLSGVFENRQKTLTRVTMAEGIFMNSAPVRKSKKLWPFSYTEQDPAVEPL